VVVPARPEPTPEEQLEAEVLTEFERQTLGIYRQDGRPHYPVGPALQAQLFELFLLGTGCEEITKLNPGLGLAQVLEARLAYRWDDTKARYRDDLMGAAKDRATQTLLEAADFLRTNLSVAHRSFARKAKKFLQTANPKDLPNFSTASRLSWKQYRECLELLLKLTGMAPPEKKTVKHEHSLVPAAPVPGGVVAPAGEPPGLPQELPASFTPGAAALALAAIEKAMQDRQVKPPR
jgi:hypothetical protein